MGTRCPLHLQHVLCHQQRLDDRGRSLGCARRRRRPHCASASSPPPTFLFPLLGNVFEKDRKLCPFSAHGFSLARHAALRQRTLPRADEQVAVKTKPQGAPPGWLTIAQGRRLGNGGALQACDRRGSARSARGELEAAAASRRGDRRRPRPALEISGLPCLEIIRRPRPLPRPPLGKRL